MFLLCTVIDIYAYLIVDIVGDVDIDVDLLFLLGFGFQVFLAECGEMFELNWIMGFIYLGLI